MALEADGGNAPAPVIERLRSAPAEFEFFQAMRLLEAVERRRVATGGESTGAPERESVRFRNAPTLAYPEGEIASLEGDAATGFEMQVDFLGLLGTTGTLPTHYTELVLERLRARDTTLLEFLDLFQHRAVTLFLGAWRKYRFAFEFERQAEPCQDPFSRVLLALCGHGLEATRGRTPLAETSLAFLAGVLGHRPRSAIGLEGLLAEYFGVPVRVEQLVGRWIEVPAEERSRLGSSGPAGMLGQGFLLGSRVWDVGSKVRLDFGPVDGEHFRLFLPGSAGNARLAELARGYLGTEIECELVVEPEPGAVPAVQLGGSSRMGRDTWLASSTGRQAAATLKLAANDETEERWDR